MQQVGLIDILRDPGRLAALHETALTESRSDEAFDRLTRLASRILGVPIALVVLVDEDRQYFRSHVGLPAPYSRTRQTPLTHSFCQHIVLTRQPLVVEDATEDPDFRGNPAIRDLGVIAYLGVPLATPDGHMLGSLCVIDHEPRAWTDGDVEILQDLAGSVMTEIELRLTVKEAEAAVGGQAALLVELRETEQRFRELAENIREVFWVAEPDFSRFLYVSPAYEEIWGRTVDSLYADPGSYMAGVHPEDRERPVAGVETMKSGGTMAEEYRIVRPDGEVRWLRAWGVPLLDESGEPYRMVGVTEDITERKEREETLRFLAGAGSVLASSLEYEDTFRSVARLAVESIADWCVVYVPRDGGVRRLAVAARDPEKERLASEVERRYPPADGHPAIQVIRSAEPILFADIPDSLLDAAASDEEHRGLLRGLGLRSLMYVPLVARRGVLGAIAFGAAESGRRYGPDDLAFAQELAGRAALAMENASLYQESERRREDLERITESRARLMRGFSHDVKNPLGAADGYAQLLEEGILDPLTPRQKESVGRIRRSIRSGLRLIDDLLELARAEAGQIEIRHTATDVPEAVREMAEEFRAQAEAKGLRMEIQVPDHFPVIDSDADRVRQILGNLVSNAVKYTAEGTVSVGVAIRENERAPGPGRWIAVDVADTGAGIPRDKQHLLFQEFVRIQPGSGAGSGIGLAIGRRIACALGGDISVVSEAGEGSTFTLWLPLTLLHEDADRQAVA